MPQARQRFKTDDGLRSDIHQSAPDEAEVDPSEDHPCNPRRSRPGPLSIDCIEEITATLFTIIVRRLERPLGVSSAMVRAIVLMVEVALNELCRAVGYGEVDR